MTMKLAVMSLMLSVTFAAPFAVAKDANLGEATLATPVSQPSETLINGVNWRCEANRCAATKRLQGAGSFIKQCKLVAIAVGPIVAFNDGGRSATASQVSTCNRLAQESKG
jgi:hypothetical protein